MFDQRRDIGPQDAAGVTLGVGAFGGWVPSDLRRFLPLAVFLTCLAEMVFLPTRFFFASAMMFLSSEVGEDTCGGPAFGARVLQNKRRSVPRLVCEACGRHSTHPANRSLMPDALMHATRSSPPPPWARMLGFAGLLPFLAGALVLWIDHDLSTATQAGFALAAYAATIAAFLGGVHWGPALRAGGVARLPLLWGVVPQLAGWLALLLPVAASLLTCALVLLACYAADRRLYPEAGLGDWLPMRLQLTIVAAASCLLGAAARWG